MNACIMYTVGGTRQAPSLTKGANYPTGELYVTQIKDERTDNTRAISYEFKDKLGQVVMTRQINDGANLDTYYVYDDYGNLCYVLPPLAAGKSDTATLNLLAYQYKFNDRNLCIWKKLPGCEPVYYVYDKADRLILTQDGEQRQNSEWLFSVPDALGRVVLSGICKNSLDYSTSPLQSTVIKADWKKATNNYKGYEVSGITLSTPTVLTVNYYDNYEFINLNSFPNWTFISQTGYGTQHGSNKTLLTGTIIAQLNNTNKLLYTAMYYDLKGQLIQTQSTNHLGGKETEYIAYNFTGQPIKKQHVHTKGTTTQTELYAYEYDHAGRLLTTKHKLNTGSEVILAQNTYDELGRLKSTAANSKAALTTNYTYNIRSWTKSINNTLFIEALDYNLNGNIGIQTWTQNSKTRKYVFAYDNISRLKSATYTGDGKFGATYTYDSHGNVKTLTREGLTTAGTYGTIDNLTFNYDGTGNQLKYITDAGPNVALSTSSDFKDFSKVTTAEYTYNKNGAMTNDLNKGQTVSFNSLNLPQEMLINNATAKGKNYYIYTASGAKLQVIHLVDPTLQVQPVKGTSNDAAYRNKDTTDYVGNKIYENGILNKILTDNGYIEGGIYYFYIKDHLGNNRIVANASGSVIQRNSYYPFGMSFGEESDLEQGLQNFKYNGKELDKTHGLNQYDYAARYMDPATVRFTSVDPLAETEYGWSPYVYVHNNPLRYTDPDGMKKGDPDDPIPLPEVTVTGAKPETVWYKSPILIFVTNLISGGAVDRAHRELAFDKTNPTFTQWLAFQYTENHREILGATIMGGYSIGTRNKVSGSSRFIRVRTYGSRWPSASLKEAIKRFAPNATGVKTTSGKMIYKNESTGIQIVHDEISNYFRIENTLLTGKARYLDMNGSRPTNSIIDGKTKGTPPSEYKRITHFNNID
ncbi:hypothetical protein E2605_14570 [Dysgonomonas capnocytophagoides]|uniref:RHS repeat-associated core domain-containing protein n=1 Tax=Dysgonomonas capnocytophagoides TaxID=45254 RepID=A0A4Y8L464_9BACT|nr:RHS repeat-associated core domain-containing protein [Dysgonomonas capnocytophagoides]TFD95039.1 hypothetical protein E2605_14570 [Dysgonomonas capnocytophagoides]